MTPACRYFPECPACQCWDISYEKQKASKIDDLHRSLQQLYPNIKKENISFISSGTQALRHRADFAMQSLAEQTQFGFWKNRIELADVAECLQFSDGLQKAYSEFQTIRRQHPLPHLKASVRLRVSPAALKACWLDMAHVDVKNLLDQGDFLHALDEAGFYVEIGQRAKKLTRKQGRLKLSEPELHPWFQTLNGQEETMSLSCYVSDFTQPSWVTGGELVKTVNRWVKANSNIQHIAEFGPGIGAFTLSLLSQGFQVSAFEIKKESVTALEYNAKVHHLAEKLQIYCGDYQIKKTELKTKPEAILVNPSRSGLKAFTDEILQLSPQELIYISCYPQSMLEDLKNLSTAYAMAEAQIIDQFPQTQHYECALRLQKIK